MRCLKLNSLGVTTSEEKRFYRWAITKQISSTVSQVASHSRFYQGMEYDVFEAWVERRMQKRTSALKELKEIISSYKDGWDTDMLVNFKNR